MAIDFGGGSYGPPAPYVKLGKKPVMLAFLSGDFVDQYWQGSDITQPRVRSAEVAQRNDLKEHRIYMVTVPGLKGGDGSAIEYGNFKDTPRGICKLDVKGILRGALARAGIDAGKLYRVTKSGNMRETRYAIEPVDHKDYPADFGDLLAKQRAWCAANADGPADNDDD